MLHLAIGLAVFSSLAGGRLEATGIAAAGQGEAFRWHRVEGGFGRGGMARAIALGGAGDRAIGDQGGVTWWRDAERHRADLPPVRDLVFSDPDTLWVGTADGLYRWRRDGRPERRRLHAGEAAERISDLATLGGSLVLASAGGLFWSTSGERFQRLAVGGVATPVTRVAVARLAGDEAPGARLPIIRIWAAGSRGIHALRGLPAPAGLRVLSSRPLPPIRPGQAPTLVDLVHSPMTSSLIAVHVDALAAWTVVPGPGGDASAGVWTTARPVLPPGATLRALRPVPQGFWLVTDRGPLFAERLTGPFVRAGWQVGASDCVDLERRDDGSLQVVCRSGIFVASSGSAPATTLDPTPAPPRSAASPLAFPPAPDPAPSTDPDRPAPAGAPAWVLSGVAALELPPDPPLEVLRSRAFARSGLDAAWTARLRRGLERRGFWPEVELGFGADFDDDDRRDADQSFVSGDTRRLYDRSRDRGRRFEATLRLDWDLGEIVYPKDSVDLSRELRQIVSLRDDIADEINALYFERQRIREQLARGEPEEPGAAALAHARALEIEAGLDAWTGGFVSQWRRLAANDDRAVDTSLSRSRSNRNPRP